MVQEVVKQVGGAEEQAELLKEKILSSKDAFFNSGKKYYVSNNGDDNNDGLSIETPIKSYLKIANLPLEPGDSVLLERGSVFRTSDMLWVKNGVYYGAYGYGDKPCVYGSLKDYASPEIWNKTENKSIWSTKLKHTAAGVMTFNNDKYVGSWKYTLPELEKDGDFYHDVDSGIFYLYLEAGNPGEIFNNIEIGTTKVSVRGNDSEDVQFENICFKYNTFGPFLFGEAKGVTISNCVMGWHGGAVFKIREQGPLRYGNAAEFWHTCENTTIRNCWVYQIFDAAMTFQGFGDTDPDFKNICFEENLIEYCSMNIEFWAGNIGDGSVPHIKNIKYTGNIIRFAGYGWGGIQRWDKQDQAVLLGWNRLYDDMTNFVISDNIFDCADCYIVYMKSPKEQKGLFVFNNTYYQKKVSGINDFIQVINGFDICANNEEELKKAISIFEESPRLVKWIN